MRLRSAIVRGAKVVTEGKRDTNSGINLHNTLCQRVDKRTFKICRAHPNLTKSIMIFMGQSIENIFESCLPSVSTSSRELWVVFLLGVKKGNGAESLASPEAENPMD